MKVVAGIVLGCVAWFSSLSIAVAQYPSCDGSPYAGSPYAASRPQGFPDRGYYGPQAFAGHHSSRAPYGTQSPYAMQRYSYAPPMTYAPTYPPAYAPPAYPQPSYPQFAAPPAPSYTTNNYIQAPSPAHDHHGWHPGHYLMGHY